MRIVVVSNSIWSRTGYGTQAKSLCEGLQTLGHDVANFAFYGLHGGGIQSGSIPIYPGFAGDLWGTQIIGGVCRHFKADCIITLMDIWVLPPDYGTRAKVPFIAWFPVDSDPPIPRIVQMAHVADYPVVYSRFGYEQMKVAGVECDYIPHGIDTTVFKPGDKHQARVDLRLPYDRFIVTIVANNKGVPSRKAFPENLAAFARFHKRHPDSLLYLHTMMDAVDGLDLRQLCQLVGLDVGKDVVFADQFAQVVGIPDEAMAKLYQASDVLLAASMGEGFGLPILEAQVCGCPVITTDCSSMTELTVNGIATKPLQSFYVPLGCWQQIPDIAAIDSALESAFIAVPLPSQVDLNDRTAGVLASRYNWPRLLKEYWQPFLERVEADIKRESKSNRWPREVVVKGIPMKLYDHKDSWSLFAVREELEHNDYGIEDIDFQPGDVVIDIGAHVGAVSIYLAKRFPFLRVFAFEPYEESYKNLIENIKANNVGGIVNAINVAITSDGRDFPMVCEGNNTGGASGQVKINGQAKQIANSLSVSLLDDVLHIAPNRIKLLKIDCEGSEYEILLNSDILSRVDYLAGEFHMNTSLAQKGYSIKGLTEYCESFIDPSHIRVTPCQMSE